MPFADSPGPSTSAAKPVLLFDLDGTLLSVNSFPLWVMYFLRGPFNLPRGALWKLRFAAAWAVAQRKLLRGDHRRFKSQLQRLWSEALSKDASAQSTFTTQLHATLRPNMRAILEEVKHGRVDAVLATAAAGEYADDLAMALGFRHWLATGTGAENSREEKRRSTLEFLSAQSWQHRPRIFFTDHEEDLPLIRESQRVLWLGPAEELPEIQAQAPGIELIAARTLSEAEILRLCTL